MENCPRDQSRITTFTVTMTTTKTIITSRRKGIKRVVPVIKTVAEAVVVVAVEIVAEAVVVAVVAIVVGQHKSIRETVVVTWGQIINLLKLETNGGRRKREKRYK